MQFTETIGPKIQNVQLIIAMTIPTTKSEIVWNTVAHTYANSILSKVISFDCQTSGNSNQIAQMFFVTHLVREAKLGKFSSYSKNIKLMEISTGLLDRTHKKSATE